MNRENYHIEKGRVIHTMNNARALLIHFVIQMEYLGCCRFDLKALINVENTDGRRIILWDDIHNCDVTPYGA